MKFFEVVHLISSGKKVAREGWQTHDGVVRYLDQQALLQNTNTTGEPVVFFLITNVYKDKTSKFVWVPFPEDLNASDWNEFKENIEEKNDE